MKTEESRKVDLSRSVEGGDRRAGSTDGSTGSNSDPLYSYEFGRVSQEESAASTPAWAWSATSKATEEPEEKTTHRVWSDRHSPQVDEVGEMMGGPIAISNRMAKTTMDEITTDSEWDPLASSSIGAKLLIGGMLKKASQDAPSREHALQ